MTANELEWELELQFTQNFWAELEWEWELNFLKKTLTLTLNYLNKMSFNKTTVILNKRFFSIFFFTPSVKLLTPKSNTVYRRERWRNRRLYHQESPLKILDAILSR